MAILWARKQIASGGDLAERGQQSFREEYIVKSDSPNESRSAVFSAVPAYGTLHAENTGAICVKVSATKLKENPYLWRVIAEWNTVAGGDQDPREDQKQPDDRRPKWNFKFTPLQQYSLFDLDGVPFVDRAGSPFQAPAMPIFVDEITIERYEATCDRVNDRTYQNATNTDVWEGAQPGAALMANISAVEEFLFGAYWFRYTYTILVKPMVVINGYKYNAWDPYLQLNAGPRELDWTDLANPKPVPNKAGGYVDGQPQLLDYFGRAIGRDATGALKPMATAPNGSTLSPPPPPFLYLTFRVVNKTAFAPRNLVPPW